jgi:hypothetical protein
MHIERANILPTLVMVAMGFMLAWALMRPL